MALKSFRELIREVERELREARKVMRKRFALGVARINKGIVKQWYTARPGSKVGLARRSGDAGRSWAFKITDTPTQVLGEVFSAGIAYVDFSEQKTIVPTKKKWLAIPVGAGLTPGGKARYPSGPRQAEKALKLPPIKYSRRGRRDDDESPFNFYRRDPSTILMFAKKGVKGTGLTKTKRLMFVLKKKVVRPARTAGLFPWVEKSVDTVYNRMLNLGGLI